MDWSQVFTIVGSIVAPVLLAIFGAAFAVYRASKSDTKEIKDDISKEIAVIREQTYIMDERWGKFFERMDNKMSRMDEKWERLFEKFLDGKRQA